MGHSQTSSSIPDLHLLDASRNPHSQLWSSTLPSRQGQRSGMELRGEGRCSVLVRGEKEGWTFERAGDLISGAFLTPWRTKFRVRDSSLEDSAGGLSVESLGTGEKQSLPPQSMPLWGIILGWLFLRNSRYARSSENPVEVTLSKRTFIFIREISEGDQSFATPKTVHFGILI